MKKLTFFTLSAGLLMMLAMINPAKGQSGTDTLAPQVSTLRDKISGVEDRLATAEADLAKLTKIKLSGYIQAQWQHFEGANIYPSNYFSVRRARVKIAYEPSKGVAFVLQPDFQPGNFVVKEAYTRLNEPWLKTFSLWVGKFNRPNYEVEYSSSDLEALERSRMITTLYPGEYAIGAKLEVAPQKIPLKFQLALFNGNDSQVYPDATGVNQNAKDNTDFDNYKDLMARLTYAFKLGHWGGLTIGTHGYFGGVRAVSDTLLKSDYSKNKSVAVGSKLNRNWVGVEAQFYVDFLGGLVVKGEYIMGVNAFPGYNSTTSTTSFTSSVNTTKDTVTQTYTTLKTTSIAPNIQRNFSGYYVYLIKNIGKRNQFTIRYDKFDPNTKLSGGDLGVASYNASSTTTTTVKNTFGTSPNVLVNKEVNTTKVNNSLTSGLADLAYSQITLAWSYYFDDNIKISLAYDIPMNEKAGTAGKVMSGNYSAPGGTPTKLDYSNMIHQNVLTLRFQAKF
ncbi:MAG: hypothetical protein NTU98_01280 [Bacteroidetes bacterium]|nr:hypothetical protein [Bacteroidota bacterium]